MVKLLIASDPHLELISCEGGNVQLGADSPTTLLSVPTELNSMNHESGIL